MVVWCGVLLAGTKHMFETTSLLTIPLELRSAEVDVFHNESTFVVPLSWRRSIDICRPIASVCHLRASLREASGDKSPMFLVFSLILELDTKIPIAPTALRS